MQPPSLLAFEELSMNAWPALQTLLYDGWVLRFADGYTRRANSVNPLYESSLPLDEKITACEQLYGSLDLPAIFKLTPQSQPSELDEGLARRGYHVDASTSVQTLDLQKNSISASQPGFSCSDALTDDWFSAFCALSSTAEKHFAPMRQLLKLILPSHSFGMLQVDGQPVACGLCVQQEGFIGFYDIVVAKEQRRKGYGRRMMEGLLAHGQRNGARTAYLQVMLNNSPALRLYEGLGFNEVYQYWYRVK
jgi:ribosomal protein S18 acetylase RimI-like enzyme